MLLPISSDIFEECTTDGMNCMKGHEMCRGAEVQLPNMVSYKYLCICDSGYERNSTGICQAGKLCYILKLSISATFIIKLTHFTNKKLLLFFSVSLSPDQMDLDDMAIIRTFVRP